MPVGAKGESPLESWGDIEYGPRGPGDMHELELGRITLGGVPLAPYGAAGALRLEVTGASSSIPRPADGSGPGRPTTASPGHGPTGMSVPATTSDTGSTGR